MGMSLRSKAPDSAAHDEAVCVVWHPRGSRPEPLLLETLAKKGFRTISCDSPVEVTAWICASAGRRATGAAAKLPVVLLLDRPALLPASADVLETVEKYAPRAARWTYSPSSTPKLRRLATAQTQSSDSPSLRLAGEGLLEEIKPVSPSDPTEEDPPLAASGSLRNLLTDQELAMLLDDGGTSPEQHPHPRRVPRS